MLNPFDEHRALLDRGQAFIVARREFEERGGLNSLIMTAIANGSVTRDAIIKTVPKTLGHRHAHVAFFLDEGTSDDPVEGYWFRDDAKQYHLHCVPDAAIPADTPLETRAGLDRTLKRTPRPSRKRRSNVQHPIDADIPF